ncbi:hypothetical protein C8J56DRAFT_1038529 [Mycena floridula]|nr:hypothetical protein C8J56DRAFT_1038529 [Mycena floridula]
MATRQSLRPSNTRNSRNNFDLIASVSRSSGLDEDGDAIKDSRIRKTQEDYRRYIEEKLQGLLSNKDQRNLKNDQENIMILFRECFHACIDVSRRGMQGNFVKEYYPLAAAMPLPVEVYETSLILALFFNLPRHISSVAPHLITSLYVKCPQSCDKAPQTVLLCLLHQLVAGFPSQVPFKQFKDTVPPNLFSLDKEAHIWIKSVAASLRQSHYTKFERLTRQPSVSSLFETDNAFANKAFCSIIDTLRARVRQKTWSILRFAYREVSCQAETSTRTWLIQSLSLESLAGKDLDLDDWLKQESAVGHVRAKEEIPGRWILCKDR